MRHIALTRSILMTGAMTVASGLFPACSFQDLGYLSEEDGVSLTSGDGDGDATGGSGGDPESGAQPGSGGRMDGEGGADPSGSGGSDDGSGGSDDGSGGPGDGSGGDPTNGGSDSCGSSVCSLTHAESAACVEGVCEMVCESEYDSCNDASINDGCETDLTRVENCGSCGHTCSQYGVSSDRCLDAVCDPICLSEYADCSEDSGTAVDDGCETHLNGLKTCGKTCGAMSQCGSGQVCNNGSCTGALGLGAMVVPFTGPGQRQRFGYLFSSTSDLSGSSFVLRLHAPGAAVQIDVYASDENSNPSVWQSIDLTGTSGWTDIEVDIIPQGDFDISNVKQITWEFLSLDASHYSTLKFSLDRIWSTRLSVDDSFDSNLSGLHPSNYVYVNGWQLFWANNLP